MSIKDADIDSEKSHEKKFFSSDMEFSMVKNKLEGYKLLMDGVRSKIAELSRRKEELWFSKLLQGLDAIKTILEKPELLHEDALLIQKIINELKEMREPFDEFMDNIALRAIFVFADDIVNIVKRGDIEEIEQVRSEFLNPNSVINCWV